MHVDGFRFDLAATLARELHDVDRLSAFFDIIQQDPVISQVKLIAEPWDVGEGGYQVGNFPPLWSEWNGKYRDSVRDFWRGTDQTLAEFAYRFTGSSDLYEGTARSRTRASTSSPRTTGSRCAIWSPTTTSTTRPTARTTATARATTARGTAAPRGRPTMRRCWRCATADAQLPDHPDAVAGRADAARRRRDRPYAAAATTTPYCQDNEISWFDWEHADEDLLQFTRGLIRMRHRHPVFCRRRWFQGRPIRGTNVSDIGWFTPAGSEMSEEDWQAGFAKSLGVFLNGRGIPTPNERGERVTDESFYMMFNSSHEPVEFTLPEPKWGRQWIELIQTDGQAEETDEDRTGVEYVSGGKVSVPPWSLALLRRIGLRRDVPPRRRRRSRRSGITESRRSTSTRSASVTRRRAIDPCAPSSGRCGGRGPPADGPLVVRAGERCTSARPRSISRTAARSPSTAGCPGPAARVSRAGRPSRQPARLIVAHRPVHLPAVSPPGAGRFSSTRAVAAQLGHRRSRRSALARTLGARAGAGIALINPLAAPAPTLPQQPSPYFPSSRRFRSPLYLRIEEIEGARDVAAVGPLAHAARRLNRESTDRSRRRLRPEIARARSYLGGRARPHRRPFRTVPARAGRAARVRDVLCAGREVRGRMAAVAGRVPASAVARGGANRALGPDA
jgi:hypothetical protein